jgi:ATP-dependent Clp protease protease subunit
MKEEADKSPPHKSAHLKVCGVHPIAQACPLSKEIIMADKPNILAPSVEAKGSGSVVVYVNVFTEASAKAFFDEFKKARDAEQSVVPVIIDSYGGYVDSLAVMVDTILAFPGKVATVCVGKAMSCGAILLACGEKGMRYAAPNSRIMVHQVSGCSWDTVAGMENSVAETRRLNNQMFRVMAKRCGLPADYFLKLIKERENLDVYMTPEDAKTHKIVDHVKYPLIKTETVTRISIE